MHAATAFARQFGSGLDRDWDDLDAEFVPLKDDEVGGHDRRRPGVWYARMDEAKTLGNFLRLFPRKQCVLLPDVYRGRCELGEQVNAFLAIRQVVVNPAGDRRVHHG